MEKNTKHNALACTNCQNTIVEVDEISLIELFFTILKYKFHVLIIVGLSLSVAIIYLLVTPKIFKAESIIIPLQGRSSIALPSNLMGLTGLKEMIGETMPGLVEAPNSVKIRSILSGRRLNLMLVEKFDLLPILYSDQWDKTKQNWINQNQQTNIISKIANKLFGMTFKEPTPLMGSELLQTKISVTINNKNSNILTIEFFDKDPNFSVTMINRYLEALDEYLRLEAINRANESRSYINTLMQAQQDDVIRKRFSELIVAFSEQELYAKMKSSFLFEVIDPPILPEKAIKPNGLLILALTFFASLTFGIFAIFIIEAIKNSTFDSKQIK